MTKYFIIALCLLAFILIVIIPLLIDSIRQKNKLAKLEEEKRKSAEDKLKQYEEQQKKYNEQRKEDEEKLKTTRTPTPGGFASGLDMLQDTAERGNKRNGLN